MTQTRLASLYEVMISTAIGLVVSVALGLVIYPLYGYPVKVIDNIQFTVIWTVASIIRQYVVRRWFNRRLAALAQRLAGDK